MTEKTQTGRRIRIRGIVQGVGFRPAVWRLAQHYRLTGHVLNDGDGILIAVWGRKTALESFSQALLDQCPPLARIDSLHQEPLSGEPETTFKIISTQQSKAHTGIVADAATCPDCMAEVNQPADRRYRYPFTNCTNCGPRLSIIDTIPYDRINTSMAVFSQCPACQREYNNPDDRRFHAQPNACPECGPRVWLEPDVEARSGNDVLVQAQTLLKQGYILAIKGIGGFHLACDATHDQAVSRLRKQKQRDARPFALMASSLDVIRRYCILNVAEMNLLVSSSAPIVLLDRDIHQNNSLAPEVAPHLNTLGFMLPYTPLHHLLMQDFEQPIVMTSANLSHDPQCIDNDSARSLLVNIADFWLMHNREIYHRMDDSVVRIINNKTQTLRRARGFAPTGIPLPDGFDHTQEILALGGELKNTFCLIKDGQAILSQHIGDLDSISTLTDYEKNLALYQRLFEHNPTVLAVDAHPEYLSSKLGWKKAEKEQLPLKEVHHHHAHIAACLADNNWPLTNTPVLGVVLDGLGYGQDGSLWGGEFLLADYHRCTRLGKFKPVALLGGAQAILEPWRNTYAHLVSAIGWEEFQTDFQTLDLLTFFKQKPVATLNAMLKQRVNTPLASSCGRLFDAVAAAIGVCREKASYEGQAAIEMEALISDTILESEKEHGYGFMIRPTSGSDLPVLDPDNMWRALLSDLLQKQTPAIIAARFHIGLAQALFEMIDYLTRHDFEGTFHHIALTGGVFQNRILFQQLTQRLEEADYNVLAHGKIPSNDGGLALGQAMVALAQTKMENTLCA